MQQHIDEMVTKAMRLAGVPERYRVARSGDFKLPPIEMNDSGLFLTGPVGRGKTHLAAAVLADMLPEIWQIIEVFSHRLADKSDEYLIGRTVTPNALWVSVPKLLLRLKRTFSQQSQECEGDVIDELIKPRLLILDDLGAEKVSDWSASNVCMILDERIAECRATIVTSNLSGRDIHDAGDERLASRLGGMEQMTVTGQDRRRQ